MKESPARTMGERIAEALSGAGISQSAAAKRIGVARPTLNRWVKQDVPVGEPNLAELAKLTGVRVAWLRYGEGGRCAATDSPHPPFAPRRLPAEPLPEAATDSSLGARLSAAIQLRDVDGGLRGLAQRLSAAGVRGGSRSMILRYLSGEVSPPAEFLEGLAAETGVRAEWLLTGRGDGIPDPLALLRRLPGESLVPVHFVLSLFESEIHSRGNA